MFYLDFVKMHGLLNSFILLSDFSQLISFSESSRLAQSVCSLQGGIGADGLVILRPSEGEADFLVDFFNADGSPAEMCGNAIRCLAKYVNDAGLSGESGKSSDALSVVFQTPAGLIRTRVLENHEYSAVIAVDMGMPVFDPDNKFSQGLEFRGYHFHSLSMGNPHAVAFVENLDFDYREVGEALQKENFFSLGVNVEFAHVVSDNEIEVRVIERGVGETLACGTGACAVAVQYIYDRGLGGKGCRIVIRLLGGSLTIHWDGNSSSSVEMVGPAEKVAVGEYLYKGGA